MKRLLFLTLAVGALVLATGARADSDTATTYYLSLGDSLAESFQPTFDYDHGYAEQLHDTLVVDEAKLKLVKLGCGGETSVSMIDPTLPWEGRGAHYHCDFPHGSQLAEAVDFLHAHAGFVRLVTIDIGGNDFIDFGDRAPDVVRTYLPRILDALRAAAPGVPIYAMNYYDPFLPATWNQTHDPRAVGDAAAVVVGFNALLTSLYRAAGVPVADVESAFHVTDTTLVDGTPIDVSVECVWTWFCSQASAGDIHPNTTGYGAIAQAIAALIGAPYVDDVLSFPYIGLPQYVCPTSAGYVPLALVAKPATDPLRQYDLNHDNVICRRLV
jgi:lysophospholipase L1-like esterase